MDEKAVEVGLVVVGSVAWMILLSMSGLEEGGDGDGVPEAG